MCEMEHPLYDTTPEHQKGYNQNVDICIYATTVYMFVHAYMRIDACS